MADRTHIEWTDATWNPVTGCTKISDGCTHCYIDRTPPFRIAHRRFQHPDPLAGAPDRIGATTGVQLHPDRLGQPTAWRKPRRIFVCSLADLFHDDVPDGHIAAVWAAMAAARHHTFQVLTKRSARARTLLTDPRFQDLMAEAWFSIPRAGRPGSVIEWPLPNVWLGVSAETQQWADIRIPDLLGSPAAVRWVSAEPLLGPIDLRRLPFPRWSGVVRSSGQVIDAVGARYGVPGQWQAPAVGLDWVVAGGESGPGSRPMHPDWARDLRDQCDEAGVAFLFKQWGEWAPIGVNDDSDQPAGYTLAGDPDADGLQPVMHRSGKKRAGRLLDGRTHDAYPDQPQLR